MTPRFLRRTPIAFPLLLTALGLVHCSFNESKDRTVDDDSEGGGTSPIENPEKKLAFGEPKPDSDGNRLSVLCGAGECIPDDAASCLNMGGLGGGSGSESPMGGSAGGVGYTPGDLDAVGIACQVSGGQCDGGECSPSRQCAAAGATKEGQPCVSPSDCEAGLACVGDGAAGVCRPYCCKGTSASCEKDTFCDERPLLQDPKLYVPVCLPLDNCPLSEPFPCVGEDCYCPPTKACIVVRDDGSSACTEPGAGRAGDPCTGERVDCAQGYVCSPSAGCMQLCSTVAESSGCPDGGTCQSPSKRFPPSLGLCVGLAGDSTATR